MTTFARLLCLLWITNAAWADKPAEASPESAPYLWREIVNGSRSIDAENPTAKDQKVRVLLSDFGFQDFKGQSISNQDAGITPIDSKPFTLKPGSVRHLWLTATGQAKIRPGTYTADAMIESDGKPKVSRISIRVPGAQPLPADLLQFAATRPSPFSSEWSAEMSIPLVSAIDPEQTGLVPDAPLGVLARASGPGFALVSWTPQSGPPVTALPLTVTGMHDAGIYKGSLAFPEGKSATVSVLASDWVIYPILVILAGIVFGSLVKRWVNVGREFYVFQRKVGELRLQFGKARQSFQQVTAGKPYSGYSIATDFERACTELLASVKTLKYSLSSLDKSNQDYQAALAKLNDLIATANGWTDFGNSLRTLDQNLEAIRHHITSPTHGLTPPANPPQPAILAKAALLAPAVAGQTMTLVAYPDVRSDVTATATLAAKWVDLMVAIETQSDLFTSLRAMTLDADQQRLLADADPQAPFTLLWQASDAGGLTRVETFLGRNGATLDYLRETLHPAAAPARKRAVLVTHDFVAIPTEEQVNADIAKTNLTIQLGDWLAFWIAVVGGVLTGLKTYYFGQAFGTAGDYATVFLWGLGSKAIVDVASLGLDKMAQGVKSGTDS